MARVPFLPSGVVFIRWFWVEGLFFGGGRVHREDKGATAAPQRKSEDDSAVPLAKAAPKSGPSVPVSVQTKDDVYEAFMKEMEGLL